MKSLNIDSAFLLEQSLLDAIDLAADQAQMTWLLNGDGKRIAAIVPVSDAEFVLSRMGLDTPGRR